MGVAVNLQIFNVVFHLKFLSIYLQLSSIKEIKIIFQIISLIMKKTLIPNLHPYNT